MIGRGYLVTTTAAFFAIFPLVVQASESGSEARIQALVKQVQQLRLELESERRESARLREALERAQARHKYAQEDLNDLQAEKRRLEQLAGLTAKGETVQSALALIQSTHDPDRNITTIRSNPFRPTATDSKVNAVYEFAYVVSYAGQKLESDPATLLITFKTFHRPNTKYKAQQTMTFVLDGEPVELSVTGYEVLRTHRTATPFGVVRRYDERLQVTLTMDQLRHIARSSSIVVECAGIEMKLPRDFLATGGAIRERIKLASQ